MKRVILIALFVTTFLIISCVNTYDYLITANDLCKDKEHLNDPSNIRDEYDTCILFNDEDLKTAEGCEDVCRKKCKSLEQEYEMHWTDFAGCRCTCKIKLSHD